MIIQINLKSGNNLRDNKRLKTENTNCKKKKEFVWLSARTIILWFIMKTLQNLHKSPQTQPNKHRLTNEIFNNSL